METTTVNPKLLLKSAKSFFQQMWDMSELEVDS